MNAVVTEAGDGAIRIEMDRYMWVTVTDHRGGNIKSQSVEAVLLFKILEELRKLNEPEAM